MISYRQADLRDRIRPKMIVGNLTIEKWNGHRLKTWLVPQTNYKDLPDVVVDLLQEAISDTGPEDFSFGWGWQINDDEQSPSIDDIMSDLRESMHNHDFVVTGYEKGRRKIIIHYQIELK